MSNEEDAIRERKRKRYEGLCQAVTSYIGNHYPDDTTNGQLMHDVMGMFCSLIVASKAPPEVVDSTIAVCRATIFAYMGYDQNISEIRVDPVEET